MTAIGLRPVDHAAGGSRRCRIYGSSPRSFTTSQDPNQDVGFLYSYIGAGSVVLFICRLGLLVAVRRGSKVLRPSAQWGVPCRALKMTAHVRDWLLGGWSHGALGGRSEPEVEPRSSENSSELQ